jgi:LEA14-like dessication related protein
MEIPYENTDTRRMKFRLNLFQGCFLIFFLVSCATKAPPRIEPPPVPPEYPDARLVFDRIETASPATLVLLFRLEADNPRNTTARIRLAQWRAAVNGQDPIQTEAGEGTLTIEGEDLSLDAFSSGAYPVRLELKLDQVLAPPLASAQAAAQAPIPGDTEAAGANEAALDMDLVFAYEGGEEAEVQVKSAAAFPSVRAPEVEVTAIAIMKAELINTRFKVSLRITNPNFFPVELSALSYELYGGGRLWADGTKAEAIKVPARSSESADVFLVMNFIGMRRELLDQVIALRRVQYRFTGESTVSTGIEYIPQFRMKFDLSGNSEVVE